MTSVDGVYWALAAAILLIAGGLTLLIVRLAGSVGRVNRLLDAVQKETPATLASVRNIVSNAEQVTADLAETTSVVRDAASAVRLIVDRVRSAVRFLDETVFSKLSALAPLFTAVGALLGKLVAGGKSSHRDAGAAVPPPDK